MRFAKTTAVLLAALLVASVQAQQGGAEVERVRIEKKAWVALNMELTPDEADAFWPVYESYQKELNQVNARLARLIDSYATHYRKDTLTDDAARQLSAETLAIDEAELKLRRAYFNRLSKVLAARKVARYLQLEGKVRTQVRYELASSLPLAGDSRFTAPQPAKDR